MAVPVHLVSTFVLLAGLALTVFWLGGGGPIRWRADPRAARALLLVAVGMLLVGATGGVTALADTLFPREFEIGAILDVDTSEHFLTRLRFYHPMVAAAVGLAAAGWAFANAWKVPGATARAARLVVALVAVEMLLGVANVLLGTPIWLSLVHLALADGLWIAWVWLGAGLLQVSR